MLTKECKELLEVRPDVQRLIVDQIKLAKKYLVKYSSGMVTGDTIADLAKGAVFIWLDVFKDENTNIILDIENSKWL